MKVCKTSSSRAVPVVLAGVALLATTGRGQETGAAHSSRLVLQDIGLAGVDRGLHEQDVPRDPRGRSARSWARADGTNRAPYRAGSVIVKFRDGTNQNAMLTAMHAVDGTRM